MINPGDSLQTHCYYNTAGRTSGSSNVLFSSESADEMCMDFLWYYPAQFRGTDSNGDAAPFEFCGLSGYLGQGNTSYLNTVCGSTSQTSPNFALAGSYQLDRGNSVETDPLAFGTVNLAALGSTAVAACTNDPPSPPSAPPSPPSAPPSAPATAGDDSSSSTGIIIACAGGGAFLLVVAGVLLARRPPGGASDKPAKPVPAMDSKGGPAFTSASV